VSSKKMKWHIRLGESEWVRYTYARTESDGIRLLGSVRRGAQVGALGINDQGDYIQIVGDYVVSLNRSQITKALGTASVGTYRAAIPVQQKPAAPVIVIKRRRILLPA
jgi:hypothetical protein